MNQDASASGLTANKTKEERARPRNQRPDQILTYHFVSCALRLGFRLYARLKVIGLENVPKTGGVLLASNHASNLDPLVGWAAFYGYRRLRGVAKVELWKPKPLAYVMDAFDSVPVRRNTADRAMMRRVLELLAEGHAVGIFPEGTRTYDGLLNPAQPGVALLAQRSGAPVIPVALLGTYEMLPRGRKKLKRVPVTLALGKPMTFPPGTSREAVAEAIMEAIAALMTANGYPMEPPKPERAALLPSGED